MDPRPNTVNAGATLCLRLTCAVPLLGVLILAVGAAPGCGGDGPDPGGGWDVGPGADAADTGGGSGGGLVVVDRAGGTGDTDDSADAGGPDVADGAPEGAPTSIGAPCTSDDECPTTWPECGSPGLCGQCGDDDDCLPFEQCDGGLCLNRLCEEGTRACVGDHAVQCLADGQWQVQPCTAGTCADGVCGSCEEGALSCADADRVICQGGAFVASDVVACPAGTHCSRGHCVTCDVPLERLCYDDELLGECQLDGSLTPIHNCWDKLMRCADDRCVGCSAAGKTCDDDLIQCEIAGETATLEDCGAVGQMCYQGTCEAACEFYDFKGPDHCEGRVCCRSPAGDVEMVEPDACGGELGVLTPWEVCESGACCRVAGGDHEVTTTQACADQGGIEVAFDWCSGAGEPCEDDLCPDGLTCWYGVCVGEGALRFSVAWDVVTDLDLHVRTPGGSHIYFANATAGGGDLDVDDCVGGWCYGTGTHVENVFFEVTEPGGYEVWVVNYDGLQASEYVLEVYTPDGGVKAHPGELPAVSGAVGDNEVYICGVDGACVWQGE